MAFYFFVELHPVDAQHRRRPGFVSLGRLQSANNGVPFSLGLDVGKGPRSQLPCAHWALARNRCSGIFSGRRTGPATW